MGPLRLKNVICFAPGIQICYTTFRRLFFPREHNIMARYFLLWPVLFLYSTVIAHAQTNSTFCVSCQSPEKNYLCTVESEAITNRTALGLHCVIQLSKSRKHQSCTISKLEPETCDGKKVSFVYKEENSDTQAGNSRILPGGPQKQISEENGQPQEDRKKRPAKARHTERKKEPKTLVEFTDKVAKDTGKAIKDTGKALNKTGKAISNATKKTFKCIGSLFSKC